jgi:acyl-CoA thioesterase-2
VTAALGLEATDDPLRWRLPLRRSLMTAGGFLYGGAGLAAAVAALESTTGRPLVWATAQYLAFARLPGALDLSLTVSVSGRHTTQARCVVAAEDGREILVALATLGSRPLEVSGSWAVRPDVRPVEATRSYLPEAVVGTVHESLDMRLAQGMTRRQLLRGRPHEDSGGRAAFWVRMPGGRSVPTGADLAMVGDVVPSGFAAASGQPITGNSLDNTVRVASLVETEWVLADVRIHSITGGFGQGTAHLWAEDGTLLGTASQSAVVRQPPG